VPQLGHDGVDEGVARAALLPRGDHVGVAGPGNLSAVGIALQCAMRTIMR